MFSCFILTITVSDCGCFLLYSDISFNVPNEKKTNLLHPANSTHSDKFLTTVESAYTEYVFWKTSIRFLYLFSLDTMPDSFH